MRLTADLIAQAEQRTNPLGQRELVLAGLGLPLVENGAVTLDQFDAWDLSSNRLVVLDNFPRLRRLTALYCFGNLIEQVNVTNLPQLKTLVLAHNRITTVEQLHQIASCFPQLEFLDLTGNPITRIPNYRVTVVHHLQHLQCLDYQRVRRTEREEASQMTSTSAKEFEPGEPLTGKNNVFTAEQRKQIQEILAKASSMQEIQEIEESVRRGIFPSG